ncbi:MAG: hypothetical protein JO090_11085 [Rhizobacter sp.]|nr:hypothetical protein [Rhizobacter sp.]
MHGKQQRTIEQKQGREKEFSAAFVGSDAPASKVRPGAGTTWAGSAFDLATGLEVTELAARISPEDLDELFR